MKRFLIRGETRKKVKVSKEINALIKTLLFLALDLLTRPLALASLSYFVELAGGLTQEL